MDTNKKFNKTYEEMKAESFNAIYAGLKAASLHGTGTLAALTNIAIYEQIGTLLEALKGLEAANAMGLIPHLK